MFLLIFCFFWKFLFGMMEVGPLEKKPDPKKTFFAGIKTQVGTFFRSLAPTYQFPADIHERENSLLLWYQKPKMKKLLDNHFYDSSRNLDSVITTAIPNLGNIHNTLLYSFSVGDDYPENSEFKIIGNEKQKKMILDSLLEGKNDLLLSGPPGVGKSVMFQYALYKAKEIYKSNPKRHFCFSEKISFSSTYIHGVADKIEQLKQSVLRIKTAFKEENSSEEKLTVVVSVDEIDAVAESRHLARHGESSGLSALLSWMNSPESEGVVFLATTNRPEDIDPALKRSGRFKVVPFTFPGYKERMKMVDVVFYEGYFSEQAKKIVALITAGMIYLDIVALKEYIKKEVVCQIQHPPEEIFDEKAYIESYAQRQSDYEELLNLGGGDAIDRFLQDRYCKNDVDFIEKINNSELYQVLLTFVDDMNEICEIDDVTSSKKNEGLGKILYGARENASFLQRKSIDLKVGGVFDKRRNQENHSPFFTALKIKIIVLSVSLIVLFILYFKDRVLFDKFVNAKNIKTLSLIADILIRIMNFV